ncbi:MAG: bacillithiol biosynthesis cysteine-adding enzyme BshC [Gemmatimonadaceae bacterium]
MPVPLADLQVITEPLGGSPLSVAAQRGDVPDQWYGPRPATLAEWGAHARRVADAFDDRDWLGALAPALSPSGEAAERLNRAATGGGVAVTTGQQPGLFGGPAYTFSKALSALALADELEAQTGLPVVPIFWAATDDADFEEARWTAVAVSGGVAWLELRDQPPSGTPMADAPLGDVTTELAELVRAAGSAAFGDALDAARNAYRPGATIGGAYVALLRALLEPLGIAVLDASHPAVRRQGGAVHRAALVRATDVAGALTARAAELRAAGFEPQVPDVPELSLVFGRVRGLKRRIPIHEARAAADSVELEALSPNVLLRPLLERAILPTVAYAAGPAELAYFAQVSAVAQALGVETPLAVPRWSTTIIEPHVNRILRRLSLRHTDLRDPHGPEGRLARASLPRSVATALARLREAVDRAAAALSSDADAAALVPAAAVGGARAALLDRLERLERRYVAATKRREEDVMRAVATARAHLFPEGKRQERSLNFIPMLARQGPPLLAAMGDAARAHARLLIGPPGLVATAGVAPLRVERGARS